MQTLLKITGPGARLFLQGQLTCDINAVTETHCHLGAHCNRLGRMMSLFNLFREQDQYYLVMPEKLIPLTIDAFKKYTPFFQVSLETVAHYTRAIPPLPYPDMPNLYPETAGQFLPHDFHLHQTHAISFQKGCYTGQEIIARMHYRGTPKTHLYRATIHTHPSWMPGTTLCLSDNTVGTLLESRPANNTLLQHIWFVGEQSHIQEKSLLLNGTPVQDIAMVKWQS